METRHKWNNDPKRHLPAINELSWTIHCLLLLACSIPLFSALGNRVPVGHPPDLSGGMANIFSSFGWMIPLAALLAFLLFSRSRLLKGGYSATEHVILLGVTVVCVLAVVSGQEKWPLALVPTVLIGLNYGKKWAIANAVLTCAILTVQSYLAGGLFFSPFLTTSIVLVSLAYLTGGITEINKHLVEDLDRERSALKNLVDGLPVGICVFENGRVAYRNPLIGETETRLCSTIAGSPGIGDKEPAFNLEFEDRHYRIRRTIYPSESGDSTALIIENLSETRRLEEEIRRSSYLASVGEMAAGVAHELRNPLTVIRGYIQLISERKGDDRLHHVKPQLDTVMAEIDRLSRIIHDFLNLARPQHIEKIPLRLADLVSGLREFLETGALRVDARLQIEADPAEALVEGDAASLKQVLFNLVANAFQAAGKGGTVRIRTYRRDRWAVLEVADNGPGIPENLREKVFAPFFSTKESGTGIGLAICRRVALDHGGSLTCRSEPGHTRFILELPLLPPN